MGGQKSINALIFIIFFINDCAKFIFHMQKVWILKFSINTFHS